MTIENKFKKITIKSHTGNSNIKIVRGLSFPEIISPKAIVECNFCHEEYKEKVPYYPYPFIIDRTLSCKTCGHKDYISYTNIKP
jgi:hypothetical protein